MSKVYFYLPGDERLPDPFPPLTCDPRTRSQRRPRKQIPIRNGLRAGLVLLLATGAMLLNFHFTMTRRRMKQCTTRCAGRRPPAR